MSKLQPMIDLCWEDDEQPVVSFGVHEFRVALHIELVKSYPGSGQN
jgi:hypothetical protein